MPRLIRTALTGALVALLAGAFAQPAFAAVPSNDEPSGAVTLSKGTPFAQDTTQATTGSLDATLNGACGAPATEASVWFTYTPATDGAFLVDTTGSDYDEAGLMVFEGSPSAATQLGCGPTLRGVQGVAGTTYYVMAFDSVTGGANGGNLTIAIKDAPPAPTISLTIDPRGTAFKDGSALVSGTYTCTDAYDGFVLGTLTQKVGRVKITGDISVGGLTCDGRPQKWTSFVYSTNGVYAGGKAASVTMALVCGAIDCGEGWVEQTIQLSRGTKK